MIELIRCVEDFLTQRNRDAKTQRNARKGYTWLKVFCSTQSHKDTKSCNLKYNF